MKITPQEYDKLVKEKSPNSPMGRDIFFAAIVGGIICVIGQFILNSYKNWGFADQDAAAATSITLIAIGALLTGLKLYDKIAKFAGAGTIVPITGFSNAIVSPALEFKSEGYVLGMAAKMFTIAGPVLVFGIAASVLYGIILVLFGLV